MKALVWLHAALVLLCAWGLVVMARCPAQVRAEERRPVSLAPEIQKLDRALPILVPARATEAYAMTVLDLHRKGVRR